LTGEVRDAYRGDRMPGTLARSFKQIKVAFSTLFTLPQLLGIPLYERFMDSLMGGVVGLFMFRGFRNFWRVGRAIGVGTVNLFRRQKIDAGSRLNMDEGDTNLMVITSLLSMLIGVFIFGIVVVIAAGGTFGGAGAGIQW
jgi:hypothetical protein